MSESWQKLIDMILERNLTKRRTLDQVMKRYRATGETVEKVLVEGGIVTKQQLLALKSELHKLDTVDLQSAPIDVEVANLLPQAMSDRYGIVCVGRKGKTLLVAGAEPLDPFASDYVRMRAGFDIRMMLTYAGDLEETRRKIYTEERPESRAPLVSEAVRASLDETSTTAATTRRVALSERQGLRPAAPPPVPVPGRKSVALQDAAPVRAPLRNQAHSTPETPAVMAEETVGPRAVGPDGKALYKVATKGRQAALREFVAAPLKEPRTVRVEKEICSLCRGTLQLVQSLEERELLEQLLTAGQSQIEAEAVSLLLLESNGENLFFKHAVGVAASSIVNMVVPLDEASVAGWVLEHREPRRVGDSSQESIHNRTADQILGFTTRDLIAVPLLWQDEVLGVVEAVNRRFGNFTDDDVALLEVVAAQVAVVLDHARLKKQLSTLLVETVDVLVELLCAQGGSSREHLISVAQLATAVGREAGLPASEQENLCYAGLLHDIGRAGVLPTEEMNHPARGAELLGRIPELAPIVPYVRYHHERWDGRGNYGVAGENIPLPARILAIAIDWCESKPLNDSDIEQYTEYFLARFGTAFDPQLREPFERALTTTTQRL